MYHLHTSWPIAHSFHCLFLRTQEWGLVGAVLYGLVEWPEEVQKDEYETFMALEGKGGKHSGNYEEVPVENKYTRQRHHFKMLGDLKVCCVSIHWCDIQNKERNVSTLKHVLASSNTRGV